MTDEERNELLLSVRPFIFQIASRQFRKRDEAFNEDLVQHAYTAVLCKLDQWDAAKGGLCTFAKLIATHAMYDFRIKERFIEIPLTTFRKAKRGECLHQPAVRDAKHLQEGKLLRIYSPDVAEQCTYETALDAWLDYTGGTDLDWSRLPEEA